MSLRIVYGRAGSGKSQFCFNEIREKIKCEEKIYMITPEQFSFTAEQKLLDSLDTGSCLNAEVITFARCAKRVLNEIVGLRNKVISENGKKMLIYDIISNNSEKLTYLGKTEENVDLIINSLTEFKKHCVSIQNIEDTIVKTNNIKLKLKLQDILCCYKAFEEQISNELIDENDILTILKKHIDKNDMFKDALVYIDEFSGFTPQEYNVIPNKLQ